MRVMKAGAPFLTGSFKQGHLEYKFIKAGAPLSAGSLKQCPPPEYGFIKAGAP